VKVQNAHYSGDSTSIASNLLVSMTPNGCGCDAAFAVLKCTYWGCSPDPLSSSLSHSVPVSVKGLA